ncbi:IclR family transcriptional regulator [Halostagnicola sp. A56]|uniref:IclR family transcriptional regulator n=1 Tax=Halostagnicola sp. A56 TaxID=1495067 RepID=UPI00049ED5DA|nr:IclR family transcriptional regulator [Halostagnicola sp. A56]KDE59510.1 IclR family transcriptional regulator [Halostagnicola sp. A56]
MAPETGSRRIRSADRVCDILAQLREENRLSVSELASAIDLSPGTTHTYLATLESRGFVTKRDGKYQLGLELLPHGEHVRHQSPLYEATTEKIHRLAHQTGACTHLMTEHRNQLLVVQEVYGKKAIGTTFHSQKLEQPQKSFHCTAAGKAILAHLSVDHRQEIIQEHGLTDFTPATITDEDELAEELETIRERGFAFNDQEHMQGIRAIGAPVQYEDDKIVGAISLSGSASNWNGDRFRRELPEEVMRVANAIEVDLHSTDRN